MKIKQVHIDNAKFFTLLDLNSLHVGDELVYNIFIQRNKDYVIIIEAGTKLSDELYEKLQKQEQLYVSKMEMNRQKPSCDTLIAYIKYYKHNLEKSLHFLYEINDKLFTEFLDSKNNTINTSCLQTIVKSIIFLIQQNQNYLKETMPYFSSEYSIAYHSLHVAIYTINLSHLLRLQEEQLIDAGIAGLLHDLGLKKINNSILTKEQPLSFKELELVHKHSIYKRIIVPGSFDALTHDDDYRKEKKGGILIYLEDDNTFNVKFLLNRYALKFTTINVKDKDLDTLSKQLDKFRKKDVRVRLVIDNDSQLTKNLKELIQKYPELHITIKKNKKNSNTETLNKTIKKIDIIKLDHDTIVEYINKKEDNKDTAKNMIEIMDRL